LKAVIQRLSSYLPLTYADIIARSLKGCGSVLDIGCGQGELMSSMKRRVNAYCVGLELYLPYLYEAKKKRSHDDFILADARKIPVKPRSFDAVLASQVIEHMSKNDGLEMLDTIERIAKKCCVVAVPVGFIPYEPLNVQDLDENPLQKHLTGYNTAEFQQRRYEVWGQGLRIIYGERGLARRYSGAFRWIFYLLSYIMQFVTFFHPSLAIYMICVKIVRSENKEISRIHP
jgi:SAM-dependent methyltransferase